VEELKNPTKATWFREEGERSPGIVKESKLKGAKTK
jgi:hypothetical protein